MARPEIGFSPLEDCVLEPRDRSIVGSLSKQSYRILVAPLYDKPFHQLFFSGSEACLPALLLSYKRHGGCVGKWGIGGWCGMEGKVEEWQGAKSIS
jgi:hypothetical protein